MKSTRRYEKPSWSSYAISLIFVVMLVAAFLIKMIGQIIVAGMLVAVIGHVVWAIAAAIEDWRRRHERQRYR